MWLMEGNPKYLQYLSQTIISVLLTVEVLLQNSVMVLAVLSLQREGALGVESGSRRRIKQCLEFQL